MSLFGKIGDAVQEVLPRDDDRVSDVPLEASRLGAIVQDVSDRFIEAGLHMVETLEAAPDDIIAAEPINSDSLGAQAEAAGGEVIFAEPAGFDTQAVPHEAVHVLQGGPDQAAGGDLITATSDAAPAVQENESNEMDAAGTD